MKRDKITVNDDDPEKLKYFTVKVEALFKCHHCAREWSSHACGNHCS